MTLAQKSHSHWNTFEESYWWPETKAHWPPLKNAENRDLQLCVIFLYLSLCTVVLYQGKRLLGMSLLPGGRQHYAIPYGMWVPVVVRLVANCCALYIYLLKCLLLVMWVQGKLSQVSGMPCCVPTIIYRNIYLLCCTLFCCTLSAFSVIFLCLQCSDTVGWASGRASGL